MSIVRTARFSVAVAILALLASPPVLAGGSFEINQDCALAGCFPGDEPGFPVRIPGPGHYRLASHLIVNAGQTAIEVVDVQGGPSNSAGDVTLDLGGYTIRGPFSCNGTPVTDCTGIGSTTIGISMNVGGGTIRNGTITGFAGHGLSLTTRGAFVIDSVTFAENGRDGVRMSMPDGSVGVLVRKSRFIRNGAAGYNDALGSNQGNAIEDSQFMGNRDEGVRMSTGTVARSHFQNNGSHAAAGFIAGCMTMYNVYRGNNNGGLQTLGCTGVGNQCEFTSC